MSHVLHTQDDFTVASLGECQFESPRKRSKKIEFISDAMGIRYVNETPPEVPEEANLFFERAGPREKIFFRPEVTSAALVTCGGLSPGLNNVIRSAYLELTHNYEVPRVLGIREGYQGLNPGAGLPPIPITREFVRDIHNMGGSVLGSSRGPQDPQVTVDFLEREAIDILFCIGGDGTQRGAHAIYEEIQKRALPKAIVGIPKTIDNDIPHVWMTFGYATALEKAEEVMRAAHVEAIGAPNGIGLVKVMGRDAGFIAAGAAVASQDANFVLVPEVPFILEGDDGFLTALERRILARGHALVTVAEGAGQHLLQQDSLSRDASGNVKYEDIGIFLRDRIKEHFAARDIPINLKYLDPSYLIRSVPANAWDRVLSDRMARSAVHAAMAGKTGVLIGFEHGALIHVPIRTAVSEKKRMDVAGDIWNAVLSTTGQPHW
jgi:6-phosphofructokinase 1